MLVELFLLINLFALWAIAILNVIKINSLHKFTTNLELQLKSKIGSVIREINSYNFSNYAIDMEQDASIRKLNALNGQKV